MSPGDRGVDGIDEQPGPVVEPGPGAVEVRRGTAAGVRYSLVEDQLPSAGARIFPLRTSQKNVASPMDRPDA